MRPADTPAAASQRAKSGWPVRPIAGMVTGMSNRAETSAANRAACRRALHALAPALAIAALAGCVQGERSLFLTFAGETPGTRTPFVEIAGAPPLGRPPPKAPDSPAHRFRPAEFSSAGSAAAARDENAGGDAIAAAHRRVRRALADRDEEFALRKRSLALFAADYLAVAGALTFQAGDPLPADDARHRARMKAARDALGAIGGDLVKLNALILRIERDRIAARRVAAAAQDRGGAPAQSTGQTAAAAGRLLAAARGFAGAWLVYVGGQRETLNRLAAQVAAATGPDTVETIPVRQTLFE